jgi:hypothetical protein
MKKAPRIRVVISGDLAEALIWESERRGAEPEELVQRMLGESSAEFLNLWRESRLSRYAPNGRPSEEEIKAARLVVSRAYGPVRKRRRARTRTAASR